MRQRSMGTVQGGGMGSAMPMMRDLHVLLVEDDDFTRRLVYRLLLDLEIQTITEARDGMNALEILRDKGDDIDLIICDLEMPRMSGLDLLHALRTATGNPLADVPVIVLTAHREADMVKRAIAYGISGYLVKPVSKADLVKRVSFAMQKAR